MSKNKGNKNTKKEKATGKKKVVSDYKSKQKKSSSTTDAITPQTGNKASGGQNKKK